MKLEPKKSALLVVFLTVFIDLLGFGMVLPLLPIYAKHFAAHLGIDEQSTQMGLLVGSLMSSFSLAQFLFAPMWGRLSDRIGRRPVLMIGLGGSVVFYTLFGVATAEKSLAWLFVARVGAGIAGATISTAHAYIADVTSAAGRARGMALVGAAFGLGFTFGPLFGWLALPSGQGDPGPGPGYAAAGLSGMALLLAWFKLPESLTPGHTPRRTGWFNLASLRKALATPSIGALLLTYFVSVLAFANFESTIALLIKDEHGPFAFTFGQVMLSFAFIGLVLSLAQGLLVRRMARRLKERTMAAGGALVEVCGFWLLAQAIVWDRPGELFHYQWSLSAGQVVTLAMQQSTVMLLGALTVVVTGFAFLTPSLNALISRRSDPTTQGGTMGLVQSTSAMSRIVGPMVGVPLYHSAALGDRVGLPAPLLPLVLGGALMACALMLVLWSARGREDYAPSQA